MKLTPTVIRQFEMDQQTYGTKVALFNLGVRTDVFRREYRKKLEADVSA